MSNRTHSFPVFLLIGVVGGFVTALAFIATIQLTLPPSDGAYGQSILTALGDPFVRTIATPVALVSGLLASPLLFFSLRRRRLSVALPIVLASVILAVVVATPLSHLLGLASAFVALVLSCVLSARIPATRLEVLHDAA